MNIDFNSVRKKTETGLWKIIHNKITNKRELYGDDIFNEIVSKPDGINAEDFYRYWRTHAESTSTDSDAFSFETDMAENISSEKQYVWESPDKGNMYLRTTGNLENIDEEQIVFSGICQNITDIHRSESDVSDINSANKIIFDLRQENSDLVETLGTIVEVRNMESDTHIRCVKIFSEILASYISEHYPEYKISRRDAKLIANASPLHDVGKIVISDMILLKPGRLTRQEFEMMKTHSRRGYDIIQSISTMQDGAYKRYCSEIALNHHEKYDGRGYPNGLSGDDIPISAQIVSLADVYDALITPRIYKQAYTTKQAYNMIMRGECGEYNPKLLAALTEVRPLFENIAARYKQKSENDIC